MANDSLRNLLAHDAIPDTKWDSFVKDTLANEEHNERALLVAATVLRHLRQQKLTKVWLAERMGVSPQHVGKILKGRSNMTLETIGKLESATGLTLLDVRSNQPQAQIIATRSFFSGFIERIPSFKEANWSSLSNSGLCAC